MTDAAPHEMQHPDAPTWCIWCGTFDVYAESGECRGDRSGPARFDFAVPENHDRQYAAMFGLPFPPEQNV